MWVTPQVAPEPEGGLSEFDLGAGGGVSGMTQGPRVGGGHAPWVVASSVKLFARRRLSRPNIEECGPNPPSAFRKWPHGSQAIFCWPSPFTRSPENAARKGGVLYLGGEQMKRRFTRARPDFRFPGSSVRLQHSMQMVRMDLHGEAVGRGRLVRDQANRPHDLCSHK